MTEINTDLLSGLGLTGYESIKQPESNELGQDEFLDLMTTQLSNQDPLSPMENGDFIGQLAQFSTVTGIEELTSAFESLAQSLSQWQAMQGAALVGSDVLTPADSIELESGQTIQGAVDLSASTTGLSVEIRDAAGQLVHTLDLGMQASGLCDFDWDGLLEDGSPAPSGIYTVTANAQVGDTSEALATLLSGEVQSVSLGDGSGSLTLQVNGLGAVDFSDVQRIGL